MPDLKMLQTNNAPRTAALIIENNASGAFTTSEWASANSSGSRAQRISRDTALLAKWVVRNKNGFAKRQYQ